MHERPSPETTKRKYRRLRHLPAVILTAFLSPAFAPGNAMAVPSFTGAANVTIDLKGFSATSNGSFADSDSVINIGTPPDAAATDSAATRADGVHGTISLSGTINGTAPVSFAQAGIQAYSGIVPRAVSGQAGLLVFSIDIPTVALSVTDGAFVIVDVQIGTIPIPDVLAPDGSSASAMLVPDFSGISFNPADNFEPDRLLYSCSASNLDASGCFGPTDVVEVPVSGEADEYVMAVLTVRGTTRTEQAAAVPTPSALGLLGLAVVGMGVASRRRRIAA